MYAILPARALRHNQSHTGKTQTDMIASYARKMSRMGYSWWLLVVCLLIQGPSPGLVLCFGANGHIAAEVPHSRCPHPASRSQMPCLDVPLVSITSHEQPLELVPPAPAPNGIPVVGLAVASVSLSAAIDSGRLRPSISACTPAPSWCKTIILLI